MTAELARAGAGGAAPDTVGDVAVTFLGGLPAGRRGPAGDGRTAAQLWAREGAACLPRLAGEWLLIARDTRTGALACARSAYGSRRLFWCRNGDSVRVATSLAELLVDGGPARRLDEDFLAQLLANGVTTDEGTPWRGVYRLPPGHLLTAGPGRGPDIRRWHSPAVPTRPATVAEAVEELRDRLTAVVADYVPATGAGVLVSGGIDSNSVLAVARRVAGTDRPVVGCSLVFPGEPHDESPWLDHLDRMAPEPVRRLLPPPYDWAGWRAWSAATLLPPLRPNAALAESAADVLHAHGIGTVLTGEGGDDWFGGGPLHWPGLARRGRLAGIWRSARRANGTTRHTASAVWGAGLRPLLPHARRTIVPPWLRADFVHRTQLADRLAASDAATRRASADPQSLRHRRATMPYGEWQREIIRDRHASRGLDWRHPLHDQRVIELLLGLPGDVLWRPGETKSLLRAAVADIAPPDIVRRQSKTSFAPPIAAAIRATGGARALAGHPLVTNGYVDLDAFVAGEDAALRCHDAGRPPPGPHAGLGAVWAVHSTATWFTAVGLS